jgi:hypothetical protein
MPAPSRGDIVIAYFPQEDNETVDLRPCLVLSVAGDHLLAAKITTTELRQAWAHKLDGGTSATSAGKVLKDSWVNLRRCESIPVGDVIRVAASLKPEILEIIRQKLVNLTNA